MQAKSASRFLTSLKVAEICGVSARTVTNWIRDGQLPAHRTVGGHGRVAAEDLRRFLDSRGIPVPVYLSAPEAGSQDVSPFAPSPDGRPRSEPRRRRVLVIDDDETLLEVIRELLRSNGYDVETARHGFLGGYLVGHYQPDLILLDILMPGLDGFEVLSLMRKRPEARAIPVVACTSLKGSDAEARIRAAGFDGYVRKPLDFPTLVRTVDTLASRMPRA